MPAAGSTPYVYNLPDGLELRLFRVSPADRLKFRDRFRTARKAREMVTLSLAGVAGDALIAKLREFDARKIREHDVIQWVTEQDGAAEMLALSASHGWEIWKGEERTATIEPAERKVADIPPELAYTDYVDAAAAVAGLTLTYEDKPDPNAESRQQNETGGANQTESAAGSTSAATTL